LLCWSLGAGIAIFVLYAIFHKLSNI
jgi:hypothetical protein